MKHFRKSLAVLLSLLMLISMYAVSATVSAAEKETIIIACSDFQANSTTQGKANVTAILDAMKADGINYADAAFSLGDYSAEYEVQSASSDGLAALKEALSDVVDPDNIVFGQGNHDLTTVVGLTGWGNMDPAYGDYGLYLVEDPEQAQEWGSYDAASVTALQNYLQNKIDIGFSKPIFIMNHYPLHWSNRTHKDGNSKSGYKYFDVINAAAAQGLNIIYLHGHNHNHGYDDFLGGSATFLKKGDTIQVCQGSSEIYKDEILNFTYLNAGYVGYYNSDEATAETDLNMTVYRIRGNEVIISRYSADGQHNLKSAGVANAIYDDDKVRPAVNTTVYAGSWKIAADGTATSVDTIYEMSDNSDVFTAAQTSTSEEVSGLAFRFDVATAGMQVDETTAIYNAATVGVMDGDYQLVGMGAIVTNNPNLGNDGSAFYLDAVDGKKVIDVPAVYLCDLEADSAAYSVRVKNIPKANYDAAIYARPYYIFDYNGTQITVYGDIVGASYNGKLSNNDGELEW